MTQDDLPERRSDSAAILASVQNTETIVRKIDITLHGPEGEPHKGHIIRLDRVEQKQKWIWGALVASIVAMFKAFWSTITGK